jgi:hypothetical protein
LTIGQTLGELENRDQGQPGRVFGRLAVLRIEVREPGIGEDGTERVGDPEIGITAGEGRPGNPGGFVGQAIGQRRA